MWGALAGLVMSLVKWLFGGKKQAEGEAQGKAEQGLADQSQELRNVQKADDARNSVSDDASGVSDDPDNRG